MTIIIDKDDEELVRQQFVLGAFIGGVLGIIISVFLCFALSSGWVFVPGVMILLPWWGGAAVSKNVGGYWFRKLLNFFEFLLHFFLRS